MKTMPTEAAAIPLGHIMMFRVIPAMRTPRSAASAMISAPVIDRTVARKVYSIVRQSDCQNSGSPKVRW